jgi:ABC-type lipoprotein export system ATPase subunit
VKYNSPEGQKNIKEIWKNHRIANRLRKKYFSFVFQDDYLMPYYTCAENMLIARLIQEKLSTPFADKMLDDPMNSLDLSRKLKKNYPYNIAGGQKQRMSFIRAVVREFDIVFGDEPTGNLDYKNSNDLFRFLKEKMIQKNGTAIIVSHNIELSVEKADRIILLTQCTDVKNATFELKKQHVFTRGHDLKWSGLSENDLPITYNADELVKKIKDLI